MQSMEDRIYDRVSRYLGSRDRVIFIMDTHGSDHLFAHEERLLPVEYCIRGARDRELRGRLSELSRRKG